MRRRLLFVGPMLFFDFSAVLAPSWPNFGSLLRNLASILEVFEVHLKDFWSRFGSHAICNLVFFELFFFKASTGTLRCWAGGVTRGAKNYIFIKERKIAIVFERTINV